MLIAEKDRQRFWSKVDRNGPMPSAYTGLTTPCAVWVGSKHNQGYGQFKFRNKTWKAHRVAWMMTNDAEIPEGLIICHKCDNPGCVNGDHLFYGTDQDNADDMVAKGRACKGERHKLLCSQPPRHAGEEWRRLHPAKNRPRGEKFWKVKLREKDIAEIRDLYNFGFNQREIGKIYGVGQTAIGGVILRRTWKHISLPASGYLQ